MRPKMASGLAGLGWVAAIAVLGLVVSSPMGRLTVFAIAAVIAGILAFVSKMPSRIGRIVVAVGSLICAAASFPDAAREAERYAQRDRARPPAIQSQPPAKSEVVK
jgi:membrane protein implicated in regulation of membrane protease activity